MSICALEGTLWRVTFIYLNPEETQPFRIELRKLYLVCLDSESMVGHIGNNKALEKALVAFKEDYPQGEVSNITVKRETEIHKVLRDATTI